MYPASEILVLNRNRLKRNKSYCDFGLGIVMPVPNETLQVVIRGEELGLQLQICHGRCPCPVLNHSFMASNS